MIRPHGNDLIDRCVDAARSDTIRQGFAELPQVTLDAELLADLRNIATGVYSPLRGFMSQHDFLKVINDMTLESGVAWTLPIVLDVDVDTAGGVVPGDRVGLITAGETPVGVLDVEDVYRFDAAETARALFGTTDPTHPGVRLIDRKAPFLIGGPVKTFADALPRSSRYDLSPRETRVLFAHHGWETVVGFQTRNAPHRAHEYIQKAALEQVDGVLIHPKLGQKKPGDYTDAAILAGYEALLEHYYPAGVVALSTFTSRMWYAGPREAVFDAIVRKNHGCTHFIVGRDHAGVGDYYGDFAAQELLDRFAHIGIAPITFDYAFHCAVCDGIVSEKVCPHDPSAWAVPSGTAIREVLAERRRPVPELMRPEVADRILKSEPIFVAE